MTNHDQNNSIDSVQVIFNPLILKQVLFKSIS